MIFTRDSRMAIITILVQRHFETQLMLLQWMGLHPGLVIVTNSTQILMAKLYHGEVIGKVLTSLATQQLLEILVQLPLRREVQAVAPTYPPALSHLIMMLILRSIGLAW